jgi:putative ABC transport system permease protein
MRVYILLRLRDFPKLVPITYNLRSVFVRRSATLLTVLGIGATVAVLSGVLALQAGFQSMFTAGGRDDVAVFLRPGATNEGDSQFSRDRGLKLQKSIPEIKVGEQGPIASMEAYLAVLLPRTTGGVTNVPLRGVQPMSFEIRKGELKVVEGRSFTPGADEIIVGSRIADRIQNCRIGDTIQLNLSPFRVVGIFEHEGQFGGEIWGDLDRFLATMDRYGPNRVIAQLKPGTDVGAPDPMEAFRADDPPSPKPGSLADRLREDREVPAKVMTEKQYLASQTVFLSFTLIGLGAVLAIIMGLGAIFTATNTMLSAISARTREIGILRAMGYRPIPIFLSFMLEALVLGLVGGLVGCLLAMPFNGIKTGTMNFQTFTEMAFAFQVTPQILVVAVLFSLILGLIGGAWPAFRAARMKPTLAMRR